MTEWQPIETAPEDMRPILVFCPASRVPFQEEPDEMHIAFRKRPGTYVLQEDHHIIVEATHWLPLPEPPK